MEILKFILIILYLLTAASPIIFIIFASIYELFLKDKILKRNIEKAKIAYPKYFILKNEQDELRNKKSDKYFEYISCTKKINEINDNMKYTPNEQKNMKEIELEILKKNRIKLLEQYDILKNEFLIKTKEIENIVEKSKLLRKIYQKP